MPILYPNKTLVTRSAQSGRLYSFGVAVAASLILCLLILPPNLHAKESQLTAPDAWLLKVEDKLLAQKIAISLHSHLLSVDYENGEIVATLNENDRQRLQRNGIRISKADRWLSRWQAFQKGIDGNLRYRPHTKRNSNSKGNIPGFSCYPTVEETYHQAKNLVTLWPQLAEWIDIGDSWQKINLGAEQGFDLMVLKLTNRSIQQEKPVLFIQSAMHAREYTPAALTLDFAKQLLLGYQTDPNIRWMLDYQQVHILFHMNPDGRKVAETGLLQRKNMNQNHCPNSAIGVDLNRNFAFFWNRTSNGSSGEECSEVFRGSGPESEPETQAVSNYIRTLFADNRGESDSDAAPADTPGMHLDIHSYSQLILWPWGHTNQPSPNAAAFEQLGARLAYYNHYTPTQSIGLYPTDGTSDDVSYGELGVAALTFELGSDFFEDCDQYLNRIKPDNLPALKYALSVTRAPYLLPFGPDIEILTLNDETAPEIPINEDSALLQVAASTNRLWPAANSHQVTAFSYAIDQPIWPLAEPMSITAVESNPDNNLTSASVNIDVSNLDPGEHMIYVQAVNEMGQTGPVKALLFHRGSNQPPVATFSFNCEQLVCNFDASGSQDSDGQILQYRWQFIEEGVQSTEGPVIQHSFLSEGIKSIRLTVTDDLQRESHLVKTLYLELSDTTSEPPAQPATNSSSSGGGSQSFAGLAMLFILFLRLYRMRQVQMRQTQKLSGR